MNLVYLSGPPGVGKSTLMDALTAGCRHLPTTSVVPHCRLVPRGSAADPVVMPVELGRHRDQYSGTDALSMSIQPNVISYLRMWPAGLVLAEGDRLANLGFLTAAAEALYRVMLVTLDAPTDVLDQRCAARGSTQSVSWRRGRRTKAQRLAEHARAAGLDVYELDATAPTSTLVAQLRAALPVLEVLP